MSKNDNIQHEPVQTIKRMTLISKCILSYEESIIVLLVCKFSYDPVDQYPFLLGRQILMHLTPKNVITGWLNLQ